MGVGEGEGSHCVVYAREAIIDAAFGGGYVIVEAIGWQAKHVAVDGIYVAYIREHPYVFAIDGHQKLPPVTVFLGVVSVINDQP